MLYCEATSIVDDTVPSGTTAKGIPEVGNTVENSGFSNVANARKYYISIDFKKDKKNVQLGAVDGNIVTAGNSVDIFAKTASVTVSGTKTTS